MSGSAAIRDDVYCHLTARRAVARAALHLGVESMTAEVVDVLASCLLEYLQRLGSTAAATAEAAGRSSAHCHVYDILAASELCTTVVSAPLDPASISAASVGGAASGGGRTDLDPHTEWGRRAASWKDLAAFCFGPDWNSTTAETASSRSLDESNHFGDDVSNRGKVGPSAVGTAADSANERGWNAPFPDELPPFPVCTQPLVANPHTFPIDALALHHSDTDAVHSDSHANGHGDYEKDVNDMPDAAFYATDWNPTPETRVLQATEVFGEKRKLDATTDDSEEPPTKKVRMADGTSLPSDLNDSTLRRPRLPSYVPTFYPPFPTHQDSRVVVDDGKGATTAANTTTTPPSTGTVKAVAPTETTRQVRSALVSAAKTTSTQSHWGSSWSNFTLEVPPGRPAASEAPSASIVPLNRASGSRVSRILEGSMDPAVL